MAQKLVIKNASTGRIDEYTAEYYDGAGTYTSTQSNVVGGVAVANQPLVLGANKNVDTLVIAAGGLAIGSGAGTAVTATAAELNLLAGATSTLAKGGPVILTTKGAIDWGNLTPNFEASTGRDNSYIKMGTWATPITITQSDDHWVAIQVNIKKSGNIQFDTAAARLRVDTGGAQALSAVGCLQLRQNLGHNIGSSAILNASVNVSAAVAVGLGSLLGGYFSIEGSGAITKAGSNDCTVLVAVNNNTGGGIDNVFIAMQNGTGTTVTDIAKIVCTHGVATNGLHIYNTATDGTMTTAIKIFGALTNVFDFTGASGAVLEDNQAFPDKAGSIKIKTPAGATAYINYYDGTAG